MKKTLIFTILVISSVATYFVVAENSKSSDLKISNQTQIKAQKETLNQITKDIELYDKEDKKLLSLPNDDFDISEIEKALKLTNIDELDSESSSHEHDDIFIESSINIVAQDLEQKNGVDPLSAIEINKNSISKVKVGDVIVLPFVDAAKYKAKISEKIVHNDGSTSIVGDLVNTDKQYSIVLTEGKHSSFGSLRTPEGAYEIEVVNGKGYIYSVNEIDNKYIDYNKADVIEIKKKEKAI